jgi:gliding motility-associated-like protein
VNPGTYSLHLVASYALTGQSDSAVLKGIEVMDVPMASFATRATPVFAPDTPVEPFNYSERANLYHWDFGDGYTSSDFEPKHAYSLADTYSVMLVAGYDHGTKDIDGDGIADYNVVCYDTTRRDVVAIDGSKIQIPNAFTPNLYGPSGGIPSSGTFNDVFLPIVKGVLKFSMHIFDRWGTLVFESYDQHIGWDGYDKGGRLMPAGVYVYKLSLDFPDGERTTRLGDITLIR